MILIATLIAGLGLGTVVALSNPGHYEPRATVDEFAGDFLVKGREALDRGDLSEAESRYIYVLNIAGPQADAYCGLAEIAFRGNRLSQAARFLKKCRTLDAEHPGALELQRKMFGHE